MEAIYPTVQNNLRANAYTIRLGFNHFFQDIDQSGYGALIFENDRTDATPLDTTLFVEYKRRAMNWY